MRLRHASHDQDITHVCLQATQWVIRGRSRVPAIDLLSLFGSLLLALPLLLETLLRLL